MVNKKTDKRQLRVAETLRLLADEVENGNAQVDSVSVENMLNSYLELSGMFKYTFNIVYWGDESLSW